MRRDLTNGSVAGNLFAFSLPYLLSYFLQTLYGMADLYIIGQYGLVADITAVSVGSQVMHMLTVMIVGLAMGTTVLVGRFVGAKDKKSASLAIGNTITLFAVLSVILTVLLLALVRPIVGAMFTPAAAVGGTVDYLTVCFMGIPFIVAYNIISSIFRGLGDSKSPMVFIAIACVTNILLDIVFMGPLSMGPRGAALGTTISQAVSVVVSLVVILKRDTGIAPAKSDLKPQKKMLGDILRIGLPVSLQDGFVQISFMVITILANKRGLDDAAAVGIVEKIIGVLFLIPSSMLSSVSALAAQNLGAGKPERARKTLLYAIASAFGFGILIATSVQLCSEQIVGLFKDEPEVVRLGGEYLRSYVWDCTFAGLHFCFSGYFCALGRSGLSFFHNACSIVLVRIPLAYYTATHFLGTLYPLGWASTLGSVLSVIICLAAYALLNRKRRKLKSV